MNEDSPRVIKAYKRAALGLGAATILWPIALLFVERYEGRRPETYSWLIPIGSAILSVYYYSLYRNAKKSEE